ncbi:MAG: peptidoglycan-binding protein [Chloroflexota bacterium]
MAQDVQPSDQDSPSIAVTADATGAQTLDWFGVQQEIPSDVTLTQGIPQEVVEFVQTLLGNDANEQAQNTASDGVTVAQLQTFPSDREWPVVRYGDSDENVVTLQAMLRQQGYDISYNGEFDAQTYDAVRQFQVDNRLEDDGIVGHNTWEALISTVRLDDDNAVVEALQRQLANRYGYDIDVDGVFGSIETHPTVIDFQQSRGLSPDGIVGPDTWAALLSGTSQGTQDGGTLSHAAAMARLDEAGIPVVASQGYIGPDRTVRGGTSLEGVQASSIAGIINFQEECGCDIRITGGTETWIHADGPRSHHSGHKIDISVIPEVDNYIESNYTFIGYRGDDPKYEDPNGNIFVREDSPLHWDILFN